MTDRVFAFKKSRAYGVSRSAPRGDPEHQFQVQVATYLRYALPKDYRFTASAAGVKMGKVVAAKMKAAGQERGWPDMPIRNRKTGAVRWLELKVGKNKPTPEQQEFIDEVPGHTAVCRTLEEVEAALLSWGIKPLCAIGAASRYAMGGEGG